MLPGNQFVWSFCTLELHQKEIDSLDKIKDKIPKFLRDMPPHLILIYALGLVSSYYIKKIFDDGGFDPILNEFGLERNKK
jgi:hypothetical protein